jgi:cytochrome c biogenesis protein CcdA
MTINSSDAIYLESVLNFSSNSSNALSSFLDYFDFGYSFIAGSLAAVNPCGIVMLPVYLALYVNGEKNEKSPSFSKKVNNSLKVIFSVGSGFIFLFVLISIFIYFSQSLLGKIIPILSIFMSILIIYFGVGEILNKKTFNSTIMRLAGKIGDPKNKGVFPYILFGVSYGLVSVGCALPIFISLIANTINDSFYEIIFNFVFYSLGMLAVISILTFSTLFSVNTSSKINNFLRRNSYLIFGLFLTVAGIYMLSYWIIDIRISG